MNTLKDYVDYKLSHADKFESAEAYPLVMENCKRHKKMKDLKVYGNSFQAGTPTSENPIEVQSVGDLVTDKSDVNFGKYKIPIAQRGIHIVNPMGFVGNSLSYNEDDKTYTLKWDTDRFSAYNQNFSVIPVGSKIYIGLKWIDNYSNKEQFNVMVYYTDGTQGYYTIGKTWVSNITVDKPIQHISLYFNNSAESKGCWVKFKDLIVGYQSEFTEYEPYIEPTTTNIFLDEPLRKLGDYADYIDFKENKVVRKCVKKYLSNYNWNPNITEFDNGSYGFLTEDRSIVPDYKDNLPNSAYGFSNVFPMIHKTNYAGYTFVIWVATWASNVRIAIPAEYLTEKSVSALKTWLAENDVYMICIRKTPTEEPLSLGLPKLNAKTSIIEVDTSLAPSNAYGKYIKK